jgi:hypothetical protein
MRRVCMVLSEEAEAPSEEEEEGMKVVMVRPEGLNEEAIRQAAERLYTALTGKVGKVTKRRQLEEREPDEFEE